MGLACQGARFQEVVVEALIVYESTYGNTEAVARALGTGLAAHGAAASIVEVDDARDEDVRTWGLLLVGGPAHGHCRTSRVTRTTALQHAEGVFGHLSIGVGLRGWLDCLPPGHGHPAAAFDTRFRGPTALAGSAARQIAHRLTERGYHLVSERTSFLITSSNELALGELESAAAWGAALAACRLVA
jgi:hypothetical protein